MLYVDDVAELCFRLATASTVNHSAYLTGGYVVSYDQLANTVRDLVPGAKVTFDAAPDRGPDYGNGLSFDYDHSRAKGEFGYDLPPFIDHIRDSMKGTRAMMGIPPLD